MTQFTLLTAMRGDGVEIQLLEDGGGIEVCHIVDDVGPNALTWLGNVLAARLDKLNAAHADTQKKLALAHQRISQLEVLKGVITAYDIDRLQENMDQLRLLVEAGQAVVELNRLEQLTVSARQA